MSSYRNSNRIPGFSNGNPGSSNLNPVLSNRIPGLTVYSNGNQIYNNQNPVPSNRSPVSSNGIPVYSNGNQIYNNQNPVPSNRNPVSSNGIPVYSNGNQMYSNQNPVSSNRNPVTSNGNPVPAKQLPIENLCAGTLYEIFLQDHERFSTTPDQLTPTQIDNKRRLCLSYVFQASAKLTPEHWRKFIDLLKAYRRLDTFEVTRHNLGVLFEHAQDQELWDTLLELSFPQWYKDQEDREQKRYARYQKQGRGLPIV
ncbi:MAG: hypothetical protein Q9226_008904 [Calogaya cf. arnoldii]